MENKWRIIKNGFGQSTGAEPTDIETFKKDPIASLAREICQNSIDAKKEGEKKTILEFHSFNLKREDVPGITELDAEIDEILKWQNGRSEKEYEAAKEYKANINKEYISCLRISDFNTIGLSEVEAEEGTFYYLTKGNGLSSKDRLSGGSKGVGKFASFVASNFNTVFYSTINEAGEVGYLGVCKLGSRKLEGTKERTSGTMYYSSDEERSPIMEECRIDPDYIRNETGTDIYIFGFEKSESWKSQIIKKILDSFMVSIMYDELEVTVDEILINSNTIKEILDDDKIVNGSIKKSIMSQYRLLVDPKVHREKFNIDMFGEIEVFVEPYSRDEIEFATKKCVMVRYPLMKIKEIKNISHVPCSALCIIPKNKLSELLIKIENAQHTDWEYTRITNDPFKKKMYRNILDKIERTIIDYANSVLMSSASEKSDLEGAGDLLPDENEDDENLFDGRDTEIVPEDIPDIIVKKKKSKNTKNPILNSDDTETAQPEVGSSDEGDEIDVPSGHNEGSGAETHTGDETSGFNEDGDGDVMRTVDMTGIKYRFFVIDKNEGKYVVSFDSNYDEDDCEIRLNYLDDSDVRYKAEIQQCFINGIEVEIHNGIAKKFSIKPGKTKIELKTNLKELYACEVKMYANKSK